MTMVLETNLTSNPVCVRACVFFVFLCVFFVCSCVCLCEQCRCICLMQSQTGGLWASRCSGTEGGGEGRKMDGWMVSEVERRYLLLEKYTRWRGEKVGCRGS